MKKTMGEGGFQSQRGEPRPVAGTQRKKGGINRIALKTPKRECYKVGTHR